MNIETLEKILRCPSLPSLPAVAVKVIDLTANPSVRMDELSRTIQNDQGLAAKILRTVNSSFYGLRKPCSTIHAAIVMLGLGPVKTLALGFSLVAAVGKHESDFDYAAYWRRGLYTAVGAKAFAEAAHIPKADEAFLGGLLQDIGVMAMNTALGKEYTSVLAQTGGDHRKLVQAELAAFEIQHADVGSMLAERWKLPRELVLPVKYHERPTAAPMECCELIRLVAIGNLIHDVLTDADPTPAMRKLYERASQWLNLDATEVEAALVRTNQGVKELSSVFNLQTGAAADVEAVLKKAKEQIAQVIRSTTGAPDGLESLVVDGADADPLTGLTGRLGFNKALRDVSNMTRESSLGMAVAYVVVDRFKSLSAKYSQNECDSLIIELSGLMTRFFSHMSGVVCRPTPDIFAVIIPRVNSEMAAAVCEGFRDEAARLTIPAGNASESETVQLSIGIASSNGDDVQPGEIARSAATALQAARTSGGNCMRIQNTGLAA